MAFLLWGVVALGLAGVLVFSSQLEFLVPAVAAILVLALSLVPGLGDNLVVQTLVWLGLSGAGLVLFRDKLRRLKHRSLKVEDTVAGQRALVTEAIGDEPGRVKFRGTTWTARSAEPVPEGVEVVVLGQDGLVLDVERPEQDRQAEEWKALEARNPGGKPWK